MSLSQLHLQISQARKALSRTKANNYSDKSKQDYQDNLINLFEKISDEVKSSIFQFNSELYNIKRYLDFIFKNIEFLDSSTLNLIPYEIVACLKSVLDEWLNEDTEYIIVTSLVNNVEQFSFDPTLIYDYHSLYSVFEKKYNISFGQRLIQINIPKALSRDYLVSVVHYHELGHFIDIKNSISDSIANDIIDNLPNSITELSQYFPFLEDTNCPIKTKLEILTNHLAEYFCDLFASQYVGSSLANYLTYITENSTNSSWTHPSSTNRKKITEDFLNTTENVIVDLINKGLEQIMQKKLIQRFELLHTLDFYKLIPVIIQNDKQLHGLIIEGWTVWEKGIDNFNLKAKTTPHLELTQLYTIINNLIEKSIRNYIIQKTWANMGF